MDIPPVVSSTGVASGAGRAARQGEGGPRTRETRWRQSVAGCPSFGRQVVRLRGAGRQADPARPVRGSPAALALPLHVRPRGQGWPRLPRTARCCRPDRPPRPSARPRHVVRPGLPRTACAARGVPAAHGLDVPVVLLGRQRLQRRLRASTTDPERDLRPQRLSSRRRQHLRTYFTDGRGVEALGSVWTFLDLTPLGRQENVGGLTRGYPQTPPYQWWRRHDEYEDVQQTYLRRLNHPSETVVPTALWTNASGKRPARRCTAFQPVQCAGINSSGWRSSKAATVGSMIGSNIGPLRWNPPITAATRVSPVSRCACLTTLTIPA